VRCTPRGGGVGGKQARDIFLTPPCWPGLAWPLWPQTLASPKLLRCVRLGEALGKETGAGQIGEASSKPAGSRDKKGSPSSLRGLGPAVLQLGARAQVLPAQGPLRAGSSAATHANNFRKPAPDARRHLGGVCPGLRTCGKTEARERAESAQGQRQFQRQM
jgi:hypothetical protein